MGVSSWTDTDRYFFFPFYFNSPNTLNRVYYFVDVDTHTKNKFKDGRSTKWTECPLFDALQLVNICTSVSLSVTAIYNVYIYV